MTVYLKNYIPPTYRILSTKLVIEILSDYVLIDNEMRIEQDAPGDVYFNGDDLTLVSVWQDGKKLIENQYHVDEKGLTILNAPKLTQISIVTQIFPDKNTQLSGLFKSNGRLFTQCEAEGFRRITFFPDRPDVLTIFNTTIIADKKTYPVLLSNGNCLGTGEESNGRHWASWCDPFKKPSYLFALVAGDFACCEDEFITSSGRKVALQFFVEPVNKDRCAHAIASLKRAMRWDEEHYAREYDLCNYMVVAVSDFNMGAMENKGLNIFNAKFILADAKAATDEDLRDIEAVVGHEYFHNWTGNRVTCRDWFQLSLKEGLTVFREQSFSQDMNTADVCRIRDVKTLLTHQFPEDAGRLAHPVQPQSYEEINNFYTATIYEKGAEVIRMQATLLGQAGFRRGMDLYFERHDGCAVTIDDFVCAMEDANGVDFTQFKRWYHQSGTPVVHVTSSFEGDTLTLQLSQSCPKTPGQPTKEPFHIPIKVALFTQNGAFITHPCSLIELKTASETITFSGLAHTPIVSLFRDFSAPINLDYAQSWDDQLILLSCETDGYAKWHVAQALANSCIHRLMKTPAMQWHLPEGLADAFRALLSDDRLDPALKAVLLTPPSFDEVIARDEDVDVTHVEIARDAYRQLLGKALWPDLCDTYDEIWARNQDEISSTAAADRALRNICLWFLMKTDEKAALARCETQFATAGTMTDKIASLSLLIDSPLSSKRVSGLAEFYQAWMDNPLVIDKWFAVQAKTESKEALTVVQALCEHPAFVWTNPNRVRAVIAVFAASNPRAFHAEDGSGYRFLQKMIAHIDTINPQLAARMATPLSRWTHLNAPRQAAIKQALAELAAQPLSRDLKEVVTKSLATMDEA